jgi:hypothetical protein
MALLPEITANEVIENQIQSLDRRLTLLSQRLSRAED